MLSVVLRTRDYCSSIADSRQVREGMSQVVPENYMLVRVWMIVSFDLENLASGELSEGLKASFVSHFYSTVRW